MLDLLDLDFRQYRRPFRSPLRTAHGEWSVREGLVVRLAGRDGRTGWGEVAPLPWFGTETLAEALLLLEGLRGAVTNQDLWAVDDRLPCCQFALGAAWKMLMVAGVNSGSGNVEEFEGEVFGNSQIAGLLPAGATALRRWSELYEQGHRTLKWKVTGDREELSLFEKLVDRLPQDIALRLDANGGLSRSLAAEWLERCDQLPMGRVELFEQPLNPQDWSGLQDLNRQFNTPIALDESVATGPQLQAIAEAGWSGMVVIKPAIAGYPQFFDGGLFDEGLMKSTSPEQEKTPTVPPWLLQFSGVVVSSVFETPVGQWAARQLNAQLRPVLGDRALGFGTDPWLAPLRPGWLQLLWAGDDPFEPCPGAD